MLFMATSRRKMGGKYGDEEKPNFKFDYLYDYDNGSHRQDGFKNTGKSGFEKALLDELIRLKTSGAANTPKVGIYLHGYNNHWHDSIDEIFDFEKALKNEIGYAPVIVGFSWPSSGTTKAYLSDREEVRDSVPAFARFLRDINEFISRNEHRCFSTSYCVAHSMGNYLLRKGMEYLSDNLGNPIGRNMFDETIMLAADLASSDIELHGKGQYITQFSRRVHVYYSRFDRALKLSSNKRFGQRRLGRHGPNDYEYLADNVVVVDAEKYANSDGITGTLDRAGEQVSVHSSHRYQQSIVADIVQVMSSLDRGLIPNREVVSDPARSGSLRDNHYVLS